MKVLLRIGPDCRQLSSAERMSMARRLANRPNCPLTDPRLRFVANPTYAERLDLGFAMMGLAYNGDVR